MTKGERQKLKTGLMFISPWIIGFLVFTLFPVGASLYYSFCDYDILTEPLWIGTLNYQEMFADELFWKTLYNTLYFAAFSIPLGLVFALLVAVLLNQAVKYKSLFRLIYYLPSLVPMVAGAMIWLWVYNGKYGLLNYGLSLIVDKRFLDKTGAYFHGTLGNRKHNGNLSCSSAGRADTSL